MPPSSLSSPDHRCSGRRLTASEFSGATRPSCRAEPLVDARRGSPTRSHQGVVRCTQGRGDARAVPLTFLLLSVRGTREKSRAPLEDACCVEGLALEDDVVYRVFAVIGLLV